MSWSCSCIRMDATVPTISKSQAQRCHCRFCRHYQLQTRASVSKDDRSLWANVGSWSSARAKEENVIKGRRKVFEWMPADSGYNRNAISFLSNHTCPLGSVLDVISFDPDCDRTHKHQVPPCFFSIWTALHRNETLSMSIKSRLLLTTRVTQKVERVLVQKLGCSIPSSSSPKSMCPWASHLTPNCSWRLYHWCMNGYECS